MTRALLIAGFVLMTASFAGALDNALSIRNLPSAVSNLSSLRKKWLDVLSKKTDIDNQFFEYLPDLTASYQGSYEPLFRTDFEASHSFALSSSWDILSGGDRLLQQSKDRLAYESLLMDYSTLYQEELYNTCSLFIAALKASRQLDLAATNEQISRLQLEYMKAKRKIGTSAEIDLIGAEADYNDALYALMDAKTATGTARSQLYRALQTNSVTLKDFDTKDLPPLTTDEVRFSPDRSATVQASSNRILQLGVDRISAVLNRWVPTVTVSAGMDWGKEYNLPQNEMWTNTLLNARIDVRVSFPIFEKNDRLNAIKKADFSLEQGLIDYSDALTNASSDLHDLLEKHNNLAELKRFSDLRLSSSRLNFQKVQDSFKLGLKSRIDFYDAEQKYLEAQKDNVFNYYEILMVRMQIGRLSGNTLLFLPE